ncbi:MAG TPA: hypothetical protein VLB01_04240 [Thermodesulfobacteriota bacterium]|nr:hypothetical protein [Thermodesulfobacteriota bacterium]
MNLFRALLLATLVCTSSVFTSSVAFAQNTVDQPITVYDPDNALHPFLLVGLVLRPPVALLEVFVRGFYNAINAEPIEKAFNIEYGQRISIDEDY